MTAEMILSTAWLEPDIAVLADTQSDALHEGKRKLRVLIVEDTPSDAALVVRSLERTGYSLHWHRVDTRPDMRTALADHIWDIIICDHLMPQFDAPTALAVLRETTLDIPFVVVSGTVDADIAIELMRLGAQDYLFKSDLGRLGTTVSRELSQASARLQQREAQAQADLALARYTELYDQAPVGYFSLARTGEILQVNRLAASLLGSTGEHLLDQVFHSYVVSADRALFRDFLAMAFESRTLNACEIRVMVQGTRMQRIVRVETSGSTDSVACRVVMTDITILANTQRQIHHAKKQWEASVDAVPELIVVTNIHRMIVRCNRAVAAQFGGAYTDFIGRKVGDVFGDSALELLEAGAGRAAHEVKCGASLFAARCFSVGSESGSGYVYVFQDVTTQKQMLHEITELNSNLTLRTRALEDVNANLRAFCAAVSHDLRAPIRRIRAWRDAVMEDAVSALGETSQRHLDAIAAETTRMTQLVEAMMVLARAGNSEMHCEVVDISSLVQSVALRQGLVVNAEQMQERLTVQAGIHVWGDARMLEVVLTNLLENAFKFSSRRVDQRIEVGGHSREGTTVFWVRDNGVGFDPSRADKLFIPFQRLHADSEFPGTGIGLATVQRVIVEHGGRIWLESRPGAGTTVYCQLGAHAVAATGRLQTSAQAGLQMGLPA